MNQVNFKAELRSKSLESQLAATQRQLVGTQGQLAIMQGQLTAAQNQKAKAQDHVREAKSNLRDAVTAWQNGIDEVRVTKRDLQVSNGEARATKRDLQAALTAWNSSINEDRANKEKIRELEAETSYSGFEGLFRPVMALAGGAACAYAVYTNPDLVSENMNLLLRNVNVVRSFEGLNALLSGRAMEVAAVLSGIVGSGVSSFGPAALYAAIKPLSELSKAYIYLLKDMPIAIGKKIIKAVATIVLLAFKAVAFSLAFSWMLITLPFRLAHNAISTSEYRGTMGFMMGLAIYSYIYPEKAMSAFEYAKPHLLSFVDMLGQVAR